MMFALINISMIIISIILILVAIITPEENSVFGHAQSRNVLRPTAASTRSQANMNSGSKRESRSCSSECRASRT